MKNLQQEKKSTQQENLYTVAKALRAKGHTGDIRALDYFFKIKQLPRMIPFGGQHIPWVGSAAYQAVAVARTYWEARVSGKKAFTYSGGHTFYNGDEEHPVHDEEGRGVIDCSTFIRLVLSGVDYLHSPYATGNREDGGTRKDLYSWADASLADNKLRFAADLAEYYFLTGRALDGFDDLRPGDLIFHAKPGAIKNRFRCISHVSIVAEEGYDELCYYNVTSDSNNFVVVRSKWSSRDDYVFAARPNYEPHRSYPTLDERINLLVPPWYGVPGTIDGSTIEASDDGKSLMVTGTPTTHASFSLINSEYPLYLRPGRYQLSGAPTRPDVTGGKTWGLVVANTRENTAIVWDIGYGAEFTLEEITPVHVYIYVSSSRPPDGYTWVPRLTGTDL